MTNCSESSARHSGRSTGARLPFVPLPELSNGLRFGYRRVSTGCPDEGRAGEFALSRRAIRTTHA